MELIVAGNQNYQIKFFIYGTIFFSATSLKWDIFTKKKKEKEKSKLRQ